MQRFILAATAVLVFLPGLTRADIFDEADITVTEYVVDGSDLGEVQRDMERKGPQGFWAYATWNVVWTAGCETSVTAEITMPVLDDDTDLSAAEVAEFDRMSRALMGHELGHVRIGLDFADDVRSQGCPADASAIHQYWLQVERDYDAETEHGLHQGVYLANP